MPNKSAESEKRLAARQRKARGGRRRQRESERERCRDTGGRRSRWGRGSIGLFSSACVDLPTTGETIHAPRPPSWCASHSHPGGCTRAGVMGEQRWWWRAPSLCGYSTLPAFITPAVAPRREPGCPLWVQTWEISCNTHQRAHGRYTDIPCC